MVAENGGNKGPGDNGGDGKPGNGDSLGSGGGHGETGGIGKYQPRRELFGGAPQADHQTDLEQSAAASNPYLSTVRRDAFSIFHRGGFHSRRNGVHLQPNEESGTIVKVAAVTSTHQGDVPYTVMTGTLDRNLKHSPRETVEMYDEGTIYFTDNSRRRELSEKILEEVDPVEQVKLVAERDELRNDEVAQAWMGLDAMTDREVVAYLKTLKADVGDDWPAAVDTPDESDGDVTPTLATVDRFRRAVTGLAEDVEVRTQDWEVEDEEQGKVKYQLDRMSSKSPLATEIYHLSRTTSYPLTVEGIEETGNTDEIESWVFSNEGDLTYDVRKKTDPIPLVDPQAPEALRIKVFEKVREEHREKQQKAQSSQPPDQVQIEEGLRILQSRKESLPPRRT